MEKEKIERLYVPVAIRNEKTNWNLDYSTATLTIKHTTNMFDKNAPDISDIDTSATNIEIICK